MDEQLDIEVHERMAGVFWAVCSLLAAALSVTGAPGAPVSTSAGLIFVLVYMTANLAYATRIAIGPPRGEAERLVAVSLVTAVLGFQQWLVGDTPMLAIMAPLFVLGAAAVLERPQRLLYLPVVIATALSPLSHEPPSGRLATEHLVLMLVLVMEMALLADYGDRLRSQRRQLAEAERDASLRAVTDELTGLANRRALVDRMAAVERDARLLVVYCDLDGFKPFNDRFGHAAGDALLERFGASLRAAVGSRGEAYRVGGDEFCVIVTTAIDEAGRLVGSLVGALAERGSGYAISCSHGTAALPTDAVDLAGAVRVADQRMYLAKTALHAQRRRRSDEPMSASPSSSHDSEEVAGDGAGRP